MSNALQERVLGDSDVRYLAVSMINAETERDRQQQIGASSLSNPCDNCLAAEFRGISRFDEFAERPFLGRSLGTLMHNGLEGRQHIAQEIFPGALMEQRVTCAVIPGYGEIPGHFDLQPTAWSIVDWKGSLRRRIALLEDYLQTKGRHRVDLPPRWVKQKDTKAYEGGYKFKVDEETVVSLSATKYREEMEKMALKYLWYFGQQNLYMRGVGARRASLVFIARDGTGFFDNPEFSGYDDPERKHDIFVLSFAYNEAYTNALIQRATDIWASLENGAKISDFQSHELCHHCRTVSDEHLDAPNIEYADFGAPAAIAATPSQLAA